MKNTLGVWILNSVLLTFSFLTADEQLSTSERRGVARVTGKLCQAKYFKTNLSLNRNSENVLLWGRTYAFASTEN